MGALKPNHLDCPKNNALKYIWDSITSVKTQVFKKGTNLHKTNNFVNKAWKGVKYMLEIMWLYTVDGKKEMPGSLAVFTNVVW